ncbi:facilitated trehalose transporter Tret1 [Tribolium castaneum]|uniref:Facilitated trehalose transporter Tret1-2 homolog-like Protein n=1 Tax=Tribolium castaneum TaxID=7070 RepID=D6X032_TRICA|nr:PREDICTED: facilitated trehalose transporter Tret1 [Tribolium castaneum]XP_015838545.1 PREDICTED: facilitated trehalose transporter Tret1 [Tribolium castaneum]XP_015838546.1 PREDICTED: facilitated trehalose transporter Tret1 [Tribolium castaneum]EFA10055.1 Facilitated trehalose transporter Tret1-2 homolog-like Protein [Tribolium castaneum]|eukprot:XP_008197334.1 PREDICTED: facilitated trehalose transporter Tret1 [Tribolium castaneum]
MGFFKGGKYSYVAAASVNILAFIVGTASSWSSPVLPKLQQHLDETPLGRLISPDEASWIGSLLSMGGIVAPLLWGSLVWRVGRKTVAVTVAVPFLVAFLVAAFAQTIALFYLARVLMGVGIGGMFCVAIIYVVEIAEDANRGLLTASVGFFIVVGLLFPYCVGPFVSIMTFNLILASITLFYIVLFWYIAPETPYWLVSVNQDREALKSLYYLRRRPLKQLEEELNQIKAYLQTMTHGSFLGIFKTRASTKALIFSIALTTFQQFSGINVIFSYMQSIFDSTGSDIPAEISSIIVAAVQMIFSTISPLLSDKAGRRTLLLISITGAALSEIVLGAYFYMQNSGQDVSDIGWLPVVTLVVFMMFYNCGMGSLPWALMSELLPSNVISKATLLITCIYWFVGWVLTQYFAALNEAVGSAGSFWLFSGFCILFDLFVYFFIFETKGKSLQEINEILSR